MAEEWLRANGKMPDDVQWARLPLPMVQSLFEQLEAAQIENRFWRSQVGADPDEPLAIPIVGTAPPEAIELGRKLAERYGWASSPATKPGP